MGSYCGMANLLIFRVVSLLIAIAVTPDLALTSFNVTDDTYFEIKWPGPLPSVKDGNLKAPPDGVEDEENANSMLIRADEQTSYRCYLPNQVHNQKYRKTMTDYNGPGPLALLQPLFEQKACSYKIESYWTYELCHGKHLRQYHEEMEGDKVHKKMEFFLGYYQPPEDAVKPISTPPSDAALDPPAKSDTPAAATTTEVAESKGPAVGEPPTISLEGTNFPYFRVNFTGGSVCDLTKQPRQVELLYICLESGRGEVYELVETESCKYRVVVMSKLLCQHPAYTVARPHVNPIKCRPADEKSPTKPTALAAQEAKQQQQAAQGHTSTLEGLFGRDVRIEATRDKDRVYIRIGSKPKAAPTPDGDTEPPKSTETVARPDEDPTPPDTATEQQPPPPPVAHPPALLLRRFVSGSDCVVGGAGWWRHELCFGRTVVQYHDVRDPLQEATNAQRTTITLGRWNEEEHLKWLAENPRARPVKNKQFSHFYSHGQRCDETKGSRSVEVRVRCLKSSSSSSAMAIMLQEPSLCQYVLTVESAMLCPLVNQVDENGLLPKELNLD